MAKLGSGKTIVIKINGKKRIYHEETVKIDEDKVENKQDETRNFVSTITKNTPLDEQAAAKELEDESFDWILPEPERLQNENNEYEPIQAINHITKNIKKSSLKSIIVSVIFAVIIGTSFGILMLKLVSTDQTKQHAQIIPAVPVSGTQISPAAEKNASAVTLKSWTAYVVQGGVYSSKEAAKNVLRQAADKGIPAGSVEINGKQYILIGVANTMDEAKSLSNYLQNKGITDAYSKPLTIPEKKLSNLNADEKAFIKDAAALFPILTKTTANMTDTGQLPKEITNAIKELRGTISQLNNKKLQSSSLIDMKKEIIAAADQVKSYQKNQDSKKLAEAQQHLLTFLSIYYSF